MKVTELSAVDAHAVGAVIESQGEPLQPEMQNFLESRFNCSFSEIRLHTDSSAAAAATLLGARAFCWGRHIVFNVNEYQPGSAATLRLLAHELTHALQQRDECFGSGVIRLGVADDPLEREADAVAQCISSPDRLPPITRGAPAALRRQILIKAPATTGVDIITAGVNAEPSTQTGAGGDLVTFNLRRNFNSANPRASRLAFTFKGHVGVTFDPGDPIRDFEFGWVQFMRQIALRFVYAGRDEREGQIEINPLSLIGTDFLIDRDLGGAAFSPFAQDPRRTTFDAASNEMDSDFGDHPMVIIPDRRPNTTTGVPNFLFSVFDHREAVSIYCIRDKFARFTQLAHLKWDLVYSATFQWRNREIFPVLNTSSFTPGKPVKGAPTDKKISTLMAKLSPTITPVFNVVTNAAVLSAGRPPPNPNRRDLDHQEDQIPALFFLEGRGSLDIP
jgi:hypothetical protein